MLRLERAALSGCERARREASGCGVSRPARSEGSRQGGTRSVVSLTARVPWYNGATEREREGSGEPGGEGGWNAEQIVKHSRTWYPATKRESSHD